MRGAMLASLWLYFVPLFILGGVVLLFGTFALLARIQGGRFVRPIVSGLARMPFIGKYVKRASQAALEKANPELASAVRKLERMNAGRDPQRAQRALSQLTPAERRAYLAAAGQQGSMPTPQNRAERRRMARANKRA